MGHTQNRSQFIVRAARDEQDFERCQSLSHSYSTEYVWQMDVREAGDELAVRFRTVRLPRIMQVAYPRSQQDLTASWQQRDCYLVAVADSVILGYVNMRVTASSPHGWIYDLVVGEPFRRRRIGSALLEQATRWALLHDIHQLTLEMQTKNYPAIIFARKHGFSFCGFSDRYYANQDIALFFGKNV